MNLDARLPKQTRDLLLAFLLILSFGLYANSIFDGFVFDDHPQIEQNPYVHSFKYVGLLLTTPMSLNQGLQAPPNIYRPLTNLLFLCSYKLFGLSPYGFHLVGILLHCVVVWLVFLVGAQLFANESLGLLAAVLFAFHPVHVEPVTWVNGVADPLMSALFLTSFWFYLRLQELQTTRQKSIYMGALIAAFVPALLAKETAMTFPVLITIFEHWYRTDRLQTSWREKLSRYAPIWAAFTAYLSLRVWSLGHLLPAQMRSNMSSQDAFYSTFALIAQYAAKLVWPTPLIAFYPFRASTSLLDVRVLLGVAVTILLVSAFVFLYRRSPLYSFAILWMCLTIAPTLNPRWMMAAVFAERYLYLPSVAFCWIVAGGLLWIWHVAGSKRPAFRWLTASLLTAVLCLAVRATVARTFDWRTDRSLVMSTLAALPDYAHMHVEYGLFKWGDGDHAEAERQWKLALQLRPDSVEAMASLGMAELDSKQYDEALSWLQRAIEIRPDFALPYMYVAQVYDAQGKTSAAEAEYQRSLDILPTNAAALNAFGQFYLDHGRPEEAAKQFRAAVNIRSELQPWMKLGKIYDQSGDAEMAFEAWSHVVQFEPLDPQAHRSLGQIYLARNQLADAQNQFQMCLLMNSADPVALAGLEKIRNAAQGSTREVAKQPQPAH
jgi:Tfp pilus assembly protein PilF